MVTHQAKPKRKKRDAPQVLTRTHSHTHPPDDTDFYCHMILLVEHSKPRRIGTIKSNVQPCIHITITMKTGAGEYPFLSSPAFPSQHSANPISMCPLMCSSSYRSFDIFESNRISLLAHSWPKQTLKNVNGWFIYVLR